MEKKIAKITSTSLGMEDHGILTAYLELDYGGTGQSTGGYGFDNPDKGSLRGRRGTAFGMEFVARIMWACGVSEWEKLKGRTILALFEDNNFWRVIGIENLPTEPGGQFVFADLVTELKGWEEE
jgi:hypothetical protein